ncbi:hypothetical protein MMC26_003058 [Xylographa opegraphella]|nr:hypothetical protein [Xylographa opegraphella]
MESVIFHKSPLADYLEGEGEADHEWTASQTAHAPIIADSPSFAPRGPPTTYSKFRRKLPTALKLDVSRSTSAVARIHDTCSSALNSRLGRTDNAQFLEQFRYTIIASQLFSDHPKTTVHNSYSTGPEVVAEQDLQANFTWEGIYLTAGIAFAFVLAIHCTRNIIRTYSSGWRLFLVTVIFALVAIALNTFYRRQYLLYVRNQAISSASSLVENAHSLDATTSAAITLIQEVELVSRGYRISSPLPPISRLDEQSQTRRCARLRRTLRTSLNSLLLPYAESYRTMRPLANELDLEKYHDIYEITRSDIQEIKELALGNEIEVEDSENLKLLKIDLHKLHVARKLFLCSLLALSADDGKPDFPRWALATSKMQTLSAASASAAYSLSHILSEEERFSTPPTPKLPLTPNHARVRAQLRKVGSLSHGIRALQAKMHILREESDHALSTSSEDVSELGVSLLSQYDSIGADLKCLTQEWEDGRAALAINIDRNDRRISSASTACLALSRSATPNSLGGLTAVGGSSPNDALKILNGDAKSRSSSVEATSSDEEVFEAIALPRQLSTLTREERLAKMREERVRQAMAREKAEASGGMLKELETVIKLRPRGRTTGRVGGMS